MAAALVLLIGAGCAGPGSKLPAPSTPVTAEAMRVLAPAAVPGIPSVTTVLTVDELATDASIPGLASTIESWGYVDGRQRTFQGPSRHLTLVVSRSLVFDDPAGAQSFVAFVMSHTGSYFGAAAREHTLVAQGRSGWIFTPPPCACHLANPAFIGVLNAGSHVVWLEINGPDATPSLLVRLLDPNRSVPIT
jgi:hypothetical protein